MSELGMETVLPFPVAITRVVHLGMVLNERWVRKDEEFCCNTSTRFPKGDELNSSYFYYQLENITLLFMLMILWLCASNKSPLGLTQITMCWVFSNFFMLKFSGEYSGCCKTLESYGFTHTCACVYVYMHTKAHTRVIKNFTHLRFKN